MTWCQQWSQQRPTGNALCALADRLSIHMTMLMTCYIGVTALQTIMMLFTSFSSQLVLAIVSAAISSPWGVISDAAVMAAVPRVGIVVGVVRGGVDVGIGGGVGGWWTILVNTHIVMQHPPTTPSPRTPTQPGAYGETRVWASVMWGVISPIAGAVNTYLGLSAGFLTYAAVSAVAIIPGTQLPTDALRPTDADKHPDPPLLTHSITRQGTQPIAARRAANPQAASAPMWRPSASWRASWRPRSHHPHLTDTFAVLCVPPPSVLASPLVSTAYIAEHHLPGAPSDAASVVAASVFASPWSPPMSAVGAPGRRLGCSLLWVLSCCYL